MVTLFVMLQFRKPQLTDTGVLEPPIAKPFFGHEQAGPLDCTSLLAKHKHRVGIRHRLVNLQPATGGHRKH